VIRVFALLDFPRFTPQISRDLGGQIEISDVKLKSPPF
jgi:hypothetical protein